MVASGAALARRLIHWRANAAPLAETAHLHAAAAAVKLAAAQVRPVAAFPLWLRERPGWARPEGETSMTRRWHGILKSAALALAVSLPLVLPAQALAETLV